MSRASKIGVVFCILGILISGGVLTYLNFFSPKATDDSLVVPENTTSSEDIDNQSSQNSSTKTNGLEGSSSISNSETDSSAQTISASVLFIAEDGFLSANPVFGGVYSGEITDIMSSQNQAVFSDAIVYIDPDPSIVVVDQLTGSTVAKIPSPIYPGNFACALSDSNGNAIFVCDSSDGYQYYWTFTNTMSSLSQSETEAIVETESIIETEEDTVKRRAFTSDEKKILSSYLSNEPGFTSRISVSPELASNLAYKLQNWQGSLFSGTIPEPQVAVFGKSIPISITSLFVLVPETQGTHTLGICDKDGKWITSRAFTAVFTESGEFRSVSLDYVSDRPQVTLHLSDNEIYYVVTGVLDSYIADSQNTLADTDDTSSDNRQLFFTIKKAP